MAAPAPPARVCSLEECSAPAAAGACSQCHTAWYESHRAPRVGPFLLPHFAPALTYLLLAQRPDVRYCSRAHQREAWTKGGHRKHCKLVGATIGSSCGSITFVGQGAGKELAQHSMLSLSVVREAGEAAALKAGYETAKDLQLREHAAAGGAGGYWHLAEEIKPGELRKTWPDERLVIKRRRFVLTLEYCIGTLPVFLVTAPEGARGFTCADVVSACARCYQWVYEKELPGPGSFAPRMGGLINRGFTNGPFQIGMREARAVAPGLRFLRPRRTHHS